MTVEEEVKEKIVDVLRENIEYELHYFPDDNYTEVKFDYDKLADALIAAGLTFDGEYKNLYEKEKVISQSLRGTSWQFKGWYEEQKHRAEKMERAFRDFLAEYFTAVNEQNSYDCGVPEMFGRYANVLPYEDIVTSRLSEYLEQAEKELAEGKSEKRP